MISTSVEMLSMSTQERGKMVWAPRTLRRMRIHFLRRSSSVFETSKPARGLVLGSEPPPLSWTDFKASRRALSKLEEPGGEYACHCNRVRRVPWLVKVKLWNGAGYVRAG